MPLMVNGWSAGEEVEFTYNLSKKPRILPVSGAPEVDFWNFEDSLAL
jgi:hypothetical protein